jgi:hypothetical protein
VDDDVVAGDHWCAVVDRDGRSVTADRGEESGDDDGQGKDEHGVPFG